MKYVAWILRILPTVSLLFFFSIIPLAGESYAWMAISGTATSSEGISVQIIELLLRDGMLDEAPEEPDAVFEPPVEVPDELASGDEPLVEPREVPGSGDEPIVEPQEEPDSDKPIVEPQGKLGSDDKTIVELQDEPSS